MEHRFDVVIYGGTASGVIAAVAAAQEGARAALVEPGGHVGGMVSSGLSHTDYGDPAVIGGLALEFYERVAQHYGAENWSLPSPYRRVAEQTRRATASDRQDLRKWGLNNPSISHSSSQQARTPVLKSSYSLRALRDRSPG